MKTKTEVVKTPEQFAQMTADEIATFIRTNKNTAIVGENVGIDRHIIKYETAEDWFVYESTNPYIK